MPIGLLPIDVVLIAGIRRPFITMRAMVLGNIGDVAADPLVFQDVPVPEPGPGEVLVEVSVCGICRTDLHVIEGELERPKLPLIPGSSGCRHHQPCRLWCDEQSGPASEWASPGYRAPVANVNYCRSGRENLCLAARFTGYQVDGGYAEYAVVPAPFAYPIPAAFSDEEAAPLLCAGIIGYRALRLSRDSAWPAAWPVWIRCVRPHRHSNCPALGM